MGTIAGMARSYKNLGRLSQKRRNGWQDGKAVTRNKK